MKLNYFKNEEINQKVKNYLQSQLLEITNCKYGYFIINKKDLNQICIINNHSEWFDLYIKFNHQMIDPIVIKSLSEMRDFSWDETILISSRLVLPKVMLHAKEYHINSGHTFILHDYKNNLVLLSLFSKDLIKKEFLLNRKNILYLLIKTHQKILFLYNYFEKPKNVNIGITNKENETLYWASLGKTYKEISSIMVIAESTVKFHIGNIVKKLGAVNIKHAIRLASDLKLIVTPSIYIMK